MHLVGFAIEIYYDARSYKRRTGEYTFIIRLILAYCSTLAVTEITWRGMTRCFINNDLKRMWKNRSGHL
jgi:hypothetical protein